MKHNERDDKWFLEFQSEMIECGSVLIVNMCEVHESVRTRRVIVVYTCEADNSVCKFLYQRV